MQLVAARALEAAEDLFLCDHAWSFDGPDMARAQLKEHPQLRARIGTMLLGRCGEGMAEAGGENDEQQQRQVEDVDWLMRGLWGLSGSYSIENGDAGPMVVHYVLDEIGSSFTPAPCVDNPDPDTAAFLMVPFINPADGAAYSIFFPRRRVCEWERATCAGLPHARSRAAALTRVLLPQPDLRVRFHIIRNARIENVGKSQSCMVSKLRIIWKQTVLPLTTPEVAATLRDALAVAGFDCKTVCQLLRVAGVDRSVSIPYSAHIKCR